MRVVLEIAPKKSFASAIDWPGLARSGRTDADALAALLEYATRYADVAARASAAFSPPKSVRGLEVVERLEGGGGTEFGVPGVQASSEVETITTSHLRRLVALLEAAWATFDAAAGAAAGKQLRLGPRGGGRQVPKIVEHVLEADRAYLHQLGNKGPGSRASITEVRGAFVETLALLAAGDPLPEPNRVRKPWPPRYAIRRSAWHALDHAWEIEDRLPG